MLENFVDTAQSEAAEADVASHDAPSDDDILDAYSTAVTRVVEKVGPSVVRLDLVQANGRAAGSGSGVIVSPDGLVLTNSHVVQSASRAKITLLDGTTVTGRVLGTDADTDLALLRIDENPVLPAARLGDSKRLLRGRSPLPSAIP